MSVEKELLEKIYTTITKHNNITTSNINKINKNIDVADCYMYVVSKMKLKNYIKREEGEKPKIIKNGLFFMDVKCKMINYYNKISREFNLEYFFNKYFIFVNEHLNYLTYEEKNILLHYIDNRYKKFIDLSFLKSNHHTYKTKYIKRIKRKIKSDDIMSFVESEFTNYGYDKFNYKEIGGFDSMFYGEYNNDVID